MVFVFRDQFHLYAIYGDIVWPPAGYVRKWARIDVDFNWNRLTLLGKGWEGSPRWARCKCVVGVGSHRAVVS